MPDWKPPPVPASRLDRGGEWRDLWDEAHRVMRPYGRTPSRHLIDQLLDLPRRRWLQSQLHGIALVTTAREARVQNDGRSVFIARLRHPATMRRTRVRVVAESNGLEIVNAIPES